MCNVDCAMPNSSIQCVTQQIQGSGRRSQNFLATRPALCSVARPDQPGYTLELMNARWNR